MSFINSGLNKQAQAVEVNIFKDNQITHKPVSTIY